MKMIDVTCPNCGCEIHIESAKFNVHDLPKDADCISRQQAIDALREEFKRIPTTAIRATHRIKQLSSAQPEPYEEDPCNGCGGCGYLGESCVGEGCGKLTERKEGEADE